MKTGLPASQPVGDDPGAVNVPDGRTAVMRQRSMRPLFSPRPGVAKRSIPARFSPALQLATVSTRRPRPSRWLRERARPRRGRGSVPLAQKHDRGLRGSPLPRLERQSGARFVGRPGGSEAGTPPALDQARAAVAHRGNRSDGLAANRVFDRPCRRSGRVPVRGGCRRCSRHLRRQVG